MNDDEEDHPPRDGADARRLRARRGPVAKAPNSCVGTVTRVTSQPTRDGADWYVGVRDEKGTTHVCQATEKAQALQTGDRVDGREMWK